MQLQTEITDNVLIIQAPPVDLDASNAEEFKGSVAPLIDGHSQVILNLQDVGFMDSAGLGAVISVYRKVKLDGGEFRVYGLSPEVSALFDLVRMQRLFDIHKDKESALKSTLVNR